MQPLTGADGWAWMRAAGYLVVGFLLRNLIMSGMRKYVDSHTHPHKAILFKRAASYTVLFLFVMAALSELGFRSGVLLAAAGVLSVAIGFASQTSTSNFISGLFLLGEKSFKVGDNISVNATRGEVVSVDWLAIKLRTFDNLYVRVPNDDLIKSHVINFSKFPIRRVDVSMHLTHDTDVPEVEKLLLALVREHERFLVEPEPKLFRNQINHLGVSVQFSVWVEQSEFFDSRSLLIDMMLFTFKTHGIKLSAPAIVAPGLDSGYNMPYP
ncbi:MAG: mechanosensitive ion channel family protein [Idiomarina sp.]|nr:mechanosensitive ion channel family protein [Idiomarina sp.]